MKNIFKDAKFGDKFRTRDGRMAVFIQTLNHGEIRNELCVENKDEGRRFYLYKDDGTFYHLHCDNDIVSRWHETINEEELDKITIEAFAKDEFPVPYDDCAEESIECFKVGFRAGYRKAMEEKQ